MQLVMAEDATPEQVEGVTVTLRQMRLEPALVPGGRSTRISLGGSHGGVESLRLERLPGVARVVDVSHPFKQASWEFRNEPTVVELPNATRIGGREIVVIAGPCPLEPEARMAEVVHGVRAAGATVLHGGVFGPQGLPHLCTGRGERALKVLARARDETGMAMVAEALDVEAARLLADYVDILQVGPGNMQNFSLLRQAARLGKPVLLVRGPATTITELLLAAEYVLVEGNGNAILCEAGVLSPSSDGRRLLDLTAVPVIKSLSHLPVIVAPGCPNRLATAAMARAAIAAGADGLIVEVRCTPGQPPSADGTEALDAAGLTGVMQQVRHLAMAVGRRLTPSLVEERACDSA